MPFTDKDGLKSFSKGKKHDTASQLLLKE